MKNALILHGTDFDKEQKQRFNNWFPWLASEIEKLGYSVWVPELPEAWHPDLNRYWNFLKDFEYNPETILVGHSSGGTMVFGLLHKLPKDIKIKLAVSVAGFYKDEGWGCEGLFSQPYDWEKIKQQAQTIKLIWSPDDPYISAEQTDYLANKLSVKPDIFPGKKHFNLEGGEAFRQFPELLNIFKQETK